MQQWYNSDGHREIMLGVATRMPGELEDRQRRAPLRGHGLREDLGAEPQPIAYGGFTDIAGSSFRDDIVWMAEEGITTGCSATKFCPDDLVHRDQMATFLRRAERLPAASRDWFADDGEHRTRTASTASPMRAWRVACETNRYCPGE